MKRIGYNGASAILLPEGLTLTAGENVVDATAWDRAKEHRMVALRIAEGHIVELGDVDREEARGAGGSKPAPIVVPSITEYVRAGYLASRYEAFVEGEKVRAGNIGAEIVIRQDAEPVKAETVKPSITAADIGKVNPAPTGAPAGVAPDGTPLVNTPSSTVGSPVTPTGGGPIDTQTSPPPARAEPTLIPPPPSAPTETTVTTTTKRNK
jgi:hypothetical protein